MKKTLGLVFLLLIASFAFAQPGTPHLMVGYSFFEDGVTIHNDMGYKFYNETYNFGTYYYNWPEQADNASGSSYNYSDGTVSIQLSPMLVHMGGNVINVTLRENSTGEEWNGTFIHSSGAITEIGTINFGSTGPTPYTISGNIGMAGVTFTGINTDPVEVVTDGTGAWQFTAVAGAEVTITPAKEGYTFDPTNFYAAAIDQDYLGFVFTANEWAPDMPMNPYPANGSNGVATELPYLWWDAPEAGVAPTSYFVTLSMNADYSAPIIDNAETTDLMYAIPGALDMGTMYYAMVTPHYAPPARAAGSFKTDMTVRTLSKSTKSRDFGPALEWSFETYVEGGNASQNGGNCNGTDPVQIDLPGVTVIIDPATGVAAFIVVDWTDAIATLYSFGAPALPLPDATFLFGFNIDASDPSNLNGVITLNVGPGRTITNLYVNNSGSWFEPATWSYDDVTGIITISDLGLSSRVGGDIEITVHDATLPVEFSTFAATFMQEGNVLLQWTTETETDMMGFYVLRSETNDQNDAIRVNPTVIAATNTSMTADYEMIDSEVEVGEYYYWIEAIENNGMTFFHGPQTVTVTENQEVMPQFTVLTNAYPNPFNPETTIHFDIAEGETGSLTIYNVLGQVVKTYGTFDAKANGHDVKWHGTDDNGNNVGSGIYFYRLETDSYKSIKKMLLLK